MGIGRSQHEATFTEPDSSAHLPHCAVFCCSHVLVPVPFVTLLRFILIIVIMSPETNINEDPDPEM